MEKIKALVIYDISNDRRRRLYVKILNNYGNRVQYSAYETWLNPKKFDKMVRTLGRITEEDDNVIIYRLNSFSDIIRLGGACMKKDEQENDIYL